MSVVITGGLGFIGAHTAKLFAEKGYEVRIVDNLHRGRFGNIEQGTNFKIFICDIRDIHCMSKILRDVDLVVHLAAIVSVVEAEQDPIKAISINSFGTHIILELMRRFDIEKIVFSSSAAVYGDPQYLPIDENHPLKPKNVYGFSKLLAEQIINWYYDIYGIKNVILRYFNVFGPKMSEGSAISNFIMNALNGEPLVIFGDGQQTRDFVFVKDVAEANSLAAEKNVIGVFNIGTGIETKIIDLAKTIKELCGMTETMIIFKEKRYIDISRSVADISQAKKLLGWRPRYDLVTGLRETIDWFKSKCIKNAIYYMF